MSRFNKLEMGSESDGMEEIRPVVKNEGYYLAEARAAFESGRFEEGLRAYAKVLEHNPQNAGAWTGQVRMLIELGEFHEAKVWADKALEKFPHEPELLAAKAVALARLGDLKAALAFSDAAVEERGNTPYIWLARADVLLARKEKRAEFSFDKAFAVAPADWFIAWLASRIYLFYQKFSLALKMAQRAMGLDTGRGVIWLQQGLCQQALGLPAMATESFEQACELDPHSTAARLALDRVSQGGWGTQIGGFWRRLFRL